MEGQKTLSASHAVIIGVGGLGSQVSHQLAAAGVGELTLIDHDRVELSNLPRQLLFNDCDIGEYKSLVARDKLAMAYRHCAISSVTTRFGQDNPCNVIEAADVVIDCTDNFNSRRLINRQCVDMQIPLITASVAHFQGQLLVTDLSAAPDSGCYQCLFPVESVESQTCRNVGVVGPMVSVMASMQALVAINCLLDIGQFTGKLLRFDGINLKWREASLTRSPQCPVCFSKYKEVCNEHG